MASEWLPRRPGEALLAGLIPSESPAQCRLALWWSGWLALVGAHSCVVLGQMSGFSADVTSSLGISHCTTFRRWHLSRNISHGGYWCWWSWMRAVCDLWHECDWGHRQSWKGWAVSHTMGERISQYSSECFGRLWRSNMPWGWVCQVRDPQLGCLGDGDCSLGANQDPWERCL